MFKLTVIAGPNRGTSFAIQEGETTLGRQEGNTIVLQSSRVSKEHCKVVCEDGQIKIVDLGSSNGTYVNGVLAKIKVLNAGDRISVGNFVLELRKPKKRRLDQAPAIRDMGSVIQFPHQSQAGMPPQGMGNLAHQMDPRLNQMPAPQPSPSEANFNPVPDDLKGKFLWYFEKFVMPPFYGMNLKQDWKILGIWIFGAFIMGNLLISVYPLLESNRITILKETGRRARLIARQISEQNAPYMAASAETKTSIGSFDREGGVRFALLLDLENRIIAPQTKRNNYLASGAEATFVRKAAKRFTRGRETGIVKLVSPVSLVAVEPLKILDARQGKNVVVAMAVVAIDTTLSTPDVGTLGIVYSKVFILTALLGGLILLILYRLTLKPFELLNEDLDKALKGELQHIGKEFKSEDTDQLWEVINSAIERLPSDGFEDGGAPNQSGIETPDLVTGLQMVADEANFGLVAFDENKKITYMNPVFEEASGIRMDEAEGQDMNNVARDEALGALVDDIFNQLENGAMSAKEQFEFSGVNYQITGVAMGSTTPKGFILKAVPEESGI